MMMTYRFDYFDDAPALQTTKEIAKILFGDDTQAYTKKIRKLVDEGNFPPPTIPSTNGRGCLYWTTPVVQKWYMEQSYENDTLVTGSNLNTD